MKSSTDEVKDLVIMNDKNGAVTTSLKVAEKFGKQHKNVLQAIDRLHCSADFRRLNFQPVEIIEKNAIGGSVKSKYYTMTQDGFTLLVFGFTGPKAAKFKETYIAAFNTMDAKLRELAAAQPAELSLFSLENIKQLHGALGFALKELDRKEEVINPAGGPDQEAGTQGEVSRPHLECSGEYRPHGGGQDPRPGAQQDDGPAA